MNLLRLWDWLHHNYNIVGGVFNYPARSLCVDISTHGHIFRVVCSSKDGHLAFSIRGATSTKEIEDNISQYIEPINKLMQPSEK